MLQTMRNNAQGLIAKIIVGFIIFVFAIWGVESIVNLGGGEKPVVKVGDVEIMKADVQRKVAEQKSELRRQFGEQYDESLFNEKFLEQSALEQLINEKVAQTQADKLGLYASSKELDRIILNTPSFQVDGKFDAEQFKMILRINNMSVLQYRSILADRIKQNQVRAAFMLSSIETPFSVKLSEALANELRTYSYVEVNAEEFEADVVLTEDEIKSAYSSDIDRYRNPEKVKIQYVLLRQSDVQADDEVTEEDIDIAYSDYVAAQKLKEQRGASHILFEVNDDRSEAEAIALAEQARARIVEGEAFTDVARDVSEDTGSAENGGSLGVNGRGAFDAQFDDALFALEEKQVSKPIVTEYGVHLIRADSIVAADIASRDEMKGELIESIKEEKAGYRFAEQTQELANLAFSAGSIDELSTGLNLPLNETGFFTADSGAGIAKDASIRRIAFEDNMKFDHEVSDVIETDEGAVVFTVSSYEEAKPKPLEEVRSLVETRLKKQKSLQLAQEKADAILAGEDADWVLNSGTLRQTTDAPRAVHQKAFALSEGSQEIVSTPGGYAVVRTDSVERKLWKDMVVEDSAIAAIRNQSARDDMISYQAWAKSNTTIEQ